MTAPDDDVPAILAQRPDLLAGASRRALRYLAGLDSRPVAPAAAAVAGLDRLDFPLPQTGRPAKDVLALLDDAASPAAARLDAVALRWVASLLGLPPGTGGGFVTGAIMANATCLAATARRCCPPMPRAASRRVPFLCLTPARRWSACRQAT